MSTGRLTPSAAGSQVDLGHRRVRPRSAGRAGWSTCSACCPRPPPGRPRRSARRPAAWRSRRTRRGSTGRRRTAPWPRPRRRAARRTGRPARSAPTAPRRPPGRAPAGDEDRPAGRGQRVDQRARRRGAGGRRRRVGRRRRRAAIGAAGIGPARRAAGPSTTVRPAPAVASPAGVRDVGGRALGPYPVEGRADRRRPGPAGRRRSWTAGWSPPARAPPAGYGSWPPR